MAADEPLVTAKDVYREVMRLSGHMEALTTRNQTADKIHEDHENRLRMLERWRYGLPASVLLAAGSIAVSLWHH